MLEFYDKIGITGVATLDADNGKYVERKITDV